MAECEALVSTDPIEFCGNEPTTTNEYAVDVGDGVIVDEIAVCEECASGASDLL